MTRVVILGAGPAGLGAALRLRREKKADVVVLERGASVGGNAASFSWKGHRLDFGSHRLHPASRADILDDVRGLLDEDLLDRPRHGRIRLLGRWVHFPLKASDLLLHAPPTFVARAAFDAATKPFRREPPGPGSFASVLRKSLGPAICRDFYFPYARKLWGLDAGELSATQARKRVAASSPAKLLKKIVSQVPGLRPPGAGRFFYPRRGFGQICDAYGKAAEEAGASIRLSHTVIGVEQPRGPSDPWRVRAKHSGGETTFEADHVWSTLPVPLLARMLDPAPPDDVLAAARSITYRAMTLAYLELATPRFTEFDAHYFPGADVRITRLSEPRNYSLATEPRDTTVLCAEIPCAVGDSVWEASPADLGRLVLDDLARSGIPPRAPLLDVRAERLPQAYPIYTTGYEAAFEPLDRHVAARPRLLSYGRQGLFAHDNTHHALAMAYAACECLRDGTFDAARWEEHRIEFAKHVVED